jgi:2-oxoglutarate ferredoxin oxidoreductase subunit gamma
MTERVIIAGFGGQGVMTIGKLLADIAMRAGRQVAFIPSYGAEVRGGTANSSIILSDETIHYPFVDAVDTLVVMNQPSYDRFRARLAPGGLVILNSSMADTDARIEAAAPKGSVLRIAATEAANALGNLRVANTVMLGAYAAARGGVGVDGLVEVLKTELTGTRAHLVDVNRHAFLKGQALAKG